MKNPNKQSVMSALAPMFNSLLGIAPDYFGYTPQMSEPGEGVKRAWTREAKQRAAQKERLKNAAPSQFTRQQRRRIAVGRAH